MTENQNIEYKESWRDEYLKWICGFANAQGGSIYIGIDDDQKVVGVNNSHRLLEDIPNKIVTTLGIVCDVNLLEREGKDVIEIVVEPSNMPIAYKGEYHIRSGATKQQLRGVALQQFILKKMGLSWDDVTMDNVSIDDIDRDAIDYFIREGIEHNRLSQSTKGSSTETSTETTVDESGNTTTTITVVTENEDGSSNITESTTITDESGNTIETTETNINNNSDGSYDSTSTTYDENGDPTETTNISGDTNGNVSTQGIEYDNGEPVVTGYTVDTSENPDGEKIYNADGANTEYYAFDLTRGFVLHMHFYINFDNQPAGQDENHHNILTMKRATPSPWYGFQLRQTSTNKYIIVGAQFSTGGNANTNISGETTSSANTYEYDLTITYNPTASTNSFVCYNNLKGTNVYRSNGKFPDVDELKYLKVTIGYAMDTNGNPFRYSNIRVMDFSITRT